MNTRIAIVILCVLVGLIACNKQKQHNPAQGKVKKGIEADSLAKETLLPEHSSQGRQQPEWAKNAVIYEVNVRQFSKEGTLAKVTEQLHRIKDLGVDVVWLMPIYPIGKKDRKGKLGSYYAIQNYKEINPNFGNKEDLKMLIDSAHALGMKVILDWVANHTSKDNIWVKKHRDFYELDSITKQPIKPRTTDWNDVFKLNYDNPVMQDSMISAMQYWVKHFDIDGYRCDVAELVPMSFWIKARKELETIKPMFMLAEGNKPELYDAFNMAYGKDFNNTIRSIAEGRKDFKAINNYFLERKEKYNSNDIIMYYITNHDENSWNFTEKEKFGENTENYVTLSYAMGGMPLIYNGQEAGLNKRLEFFEKDSIEWGNYKKQQFYKNLSHLLKQHQVLWNNGEIANMEVIKADENTLQFIISKNGEMLVFLQNYSAKPLYVSKLSLNGFDTEKDLLTNQPIPEDVRGVKLPPHSTLIIGQTK